MVIPTKVFEYASTPFPIIYSASGYTSNFLKGINSTYEYNYLDPDTLYFSILNAMNSKINLNQRDRFINSFLSDNIYKKYASFILKTK